MNDIDLLVVQVRKDAEAAKALYELTFGETLPPVGDVACPFEVLHDGPEVIAAEALAMLVELTELDPDGTARWIANEQTSLPEAPCMHIWGTLNDRLQARRQCRAADRAADV